MCPAVAVPTLATSTRVGNSTGSIHPRSPTRGGIARGAPSRRGPPPEERRVPCWSLRSMRQILVCHLPCRYSKVQLKHGAWSTVKRHRTIPKKISFPKATFVQAARLTEEHGGLGGGRNGSETSGRLCTSCVLVTIYFDAILFFSRAREQRKNPVARGHSSAYEHR